MKTKGWRNVFAFTFVQTIKAKSFIISTVILTLLLSAVVVSANIIPTLVSDNDGSGGIFDATIPQATVYVLDESENDMFMPLLTETAKQYELDIVSITAAQLDEYTQKVRASVTSEMLLHLQITDGVYDLLLSRPQSEKVLTSGDCNNALSVFGAVANNARLLALGVSADDLGTAQTSAVQTLTVAGEAPVGMIQNVLNTVVPMASSLILFMFVFIYGQMIAQSIATEKTSRVMELLLTSVKPLAVIIGKILAMGCVSLGQLILIGSISGGAFAASIPFGIVGKLSNSLNSADVAIMKGISDAFSNFTPISIILIVIIFILGFLFFALLAGLVGASVSRMEDLSAAMQPYAILGVIGFYLSYMPTIGDLGGDGGTNSIVVFSRYFPISSPFALPSAIILGQMSVAETAISIAFLAVCVVLMALLVAKVYEAIILHAGNRLKIGDIIKLAGRKKEA